MGRVWRCRLGYHTTFPWPGFSHLATKLEGRPETVLVTRRFGKQLISGPHQLNKVIKVQHE